MVSERVRRSVPWPGLIVVTLAAAAMVVAGAVAWPEMAPTIVTREAGGNHGASVVSRGVTVIVPPVALLVVAALIAAAPELDRRLRTLSGLPGQVNPRGGIRVLSHLLGGLAVVFLVLHLGLLSMHTGADFPMDRAVPAAAGLLLLLVGIALPLARPDDTYGSQSLERVRRTAAPGYRVAGFALAGLGLLTIVTAFVWPAAAIVVGGSSVLLAFMAGVAGAARARR